MNLLGKILFGWGVAVLSVAYTLASAVAAIDAYARSGWVGVAIMLILVSIVPSIVVGAVIAERRAPRASSPASQTEGKNHG